MVKNILYKSRQGWRWKAIAKNGRNVANAGEAFSDKGKAERSAYDYAPEGPLLDASTGAVIGLVARNGLPREATSKKIKAWIDGSFKDGFVRGVQLMNQSLGNGRPAKAGTYTNQERRLANAALR